MAILILKASKPIITVNSNDDIKSLFDEQGNPIQDKTIIFNRSKLYPMSKATIIIGKFCAYNKRLNNDIIYITDGVIDKRVNINANSLLEVKSITDIPCGNNKND